MKEKIRKFLCWCKHDFLMEGHIQSVQSVEGAYTYTRKCSREGCGRMQLISICALGDLGNYHFLEKEWTEGSKENEHSS